MGLYLYFYMLVYRSFNVISRYNIIVIYKKIKIVRLTLVESARDTAMDESECEGVKEGPARCRRRIFLIQILSSG